MPLSGGAGDSRNSLPVLAPAFSFSGVELHPIQALAAAESASTPTRREKVRTVIIPSWKGQIKKIVEPRDAPNKGQGAVARAPPAPRIQWRVPSPEARLLARFRRLQ